MIRFLLACLLCILTPLLARAQEPVLVMPEVPKLSVTLKPEAALRGGGYLQGQLVLQVQIASKFPFEALDVRLPQIRDAEVIRLQAPRTREVRSYAGNGYVFETALAIFPTKSGLLEVPGVLVVGAVEPESGQERAFSERSDDLRLDIAGVAPRFSDPWWLVSERVEMTETWSKPVEELRLGDVVRREITLVAFGATAAHLPELEHSRTRGIAVAKADGTAKTERTAEGVTATVTQAWDLKIETDDFAYVSPLGIAYWHPGEGREMRAALPGKRIEPLPADERALAAALMSDALAEHKQRLAVVVLLAFVLITPLLVVAIAALWQAWPTRSDLRLVKACAAAGQPAELYRAVSEWALASGIDLRALEHGMTSAYRDLERGVFSATPWTADRRKLVRSLLRLSRRLRLRGLRTALDRGLDRLLGPRRRLEPS